MHLALIIGMKVALIVGHNQYDKGAYNKSYNLHEFDFNKNLALKIEEEFNKQEVETLKINDLEIVYTESYQNLPKKVNSTGADLCVSLHSNHFNGSVSGSEVLYRSGSVKGKDIAQIFQKNFVTALGNRDRGVQGRSTSEDRGGSLLRNTSMPCVICEPFFMDNDSELENAINKTEELIAAYVNSIKSALNYLHLQKDRTNKYNNLNLQHKQKGELYSLCLYLLIEAIIPYIFMQA